MATTKLVLRIDDLAHKLVVAESEVAVGETFDVFFADAVDWDGRTVEVLLYTFDGRLLWRLSEAVEAMTEGVEKGFGVPDCVIDTVEAAEATERGIVPVVVTVLTEGADGARTTYGAAKVKLHPGLSDDGTPLVTLHTDLEAHDSDPEAHEDIRKEIVASETEILKEVDKSLHAHAQAEAAARNEAIHSALRSTYQQVYEKLEAAMKEFAQKDVAEAVEAHAGRRDNPHEVKAEQVLVGEDVEVVANIAGADNWSGAWGFDLDLKSVNPEAWAGRDAGTVAKVSQIGLQVSGRAGTNDRVWLELTGADGKVWTSKQTPSWAGSGEAVDYAFDPPAELPGGVMAARFVVTNGTNAGHAMPLRISKVSATKTPAGCDVWTADAGTAKRTDFAPRIRDTYYTLPTTETVAMALDSLEERKLDKSGGTVTGILRMKNPKVATDDDPANDIAVVPNAGGQGLQFQFPGGATAMVRAKRGTVATTEDVDSKVAAHNTTEEAHADIREKLADKAEISELVTETEAREQGDADTLDSAKKYADQRVTGVYRYKGSVATEAVLPSTGNVTGDVWNVTEDGQNWAWDGEKWDSLRGIVDLSAYETEEEAEAKYLRKDVTTTQEVAGSVDFKGSDNRMKRLKFGGTAAEAGLWARGICGSDASSRNKGGLFLNYDGREVPTSEYFSSASGEGRGVFICGGTDFKTKRCQVLRKMDGDTFYAAKEDTKNRLDELEKQMGDLLYKAIAFTSGSVSPSVAEVGSMVSSVTLKWALNKTPASLTLDGEALGVNERQKTLTGAWMIAKTWVLKATDERGATSTRNLTLAFQNKAYWGVGTATGTAIDDAFVLGLSGSAFATGRGRTFSANAGAGQYIYYVFPKAWGTPVFKVGGFEGGFALDREWEHTNASGAKTAYVAYRSTNAALGQTTVVVS